MASSYVIDSIHNPYNWSIDRVSRWLLDIGLSNYIAVFKEKKVDGKILLSDECMANLQMSMIPDHEDRDRFILSLTELKARIEASQGILNQNGSNPTGSIANVPMSSLEYTVLARQDNTFEDIAKENGVSIDELSGANPALSATQKLTENQKVYLPVIQHAIQEDITHTSPSDPSMVPQTVNSKQLENYEQCLRTTFVIVDENENGYLDIGEFATFLERLHVNIEDQTEIYDIYRDMNQGKDGELPFENFFKYVRNLITIEGDLSPAQFRLFEAMLAADRRNECTLGGITQFLNQTWSNFRHYRRYGRNGGLVMKSGENIAVLGEGNYTLVDLICWPDQLTESIEPKHAVVKNFQWRTKHEVGPNATTGELIFPSDFNPCLPIEVATLQNLKYYGCSFANETELKVSLLYRYEILDFQYLPNYLEDFVKTVSHPGLERHGFAHLDCPHDDFTKSGYFILGKITDDNELHLTAFIIPSKHTLYVPSNTIHSNDYLRGTWRTMLTEADIDHVILKKPRPGSEELEVFPFQFQQP